VTDAAAPRSALRMLGRVFVLFWFIVGGVGHFMLTNMFASIVPPYIPFPREMVYLTGVLEIAGALALL
jgi:uncharacterized membrane protein